VANSTRKPLNTIIITKIRTRTIKATAKILQHMDMFSLKQFFRNNLPKTGMLAATKKHIAEPKIFAIKIVRRNTINLLGVRCKPVIK
jgi:hypothetical protein